MCMFCICVRAEYCFAKKLLTIDKAIIYNLQSLRYAYFWKAVQIFLTEFCLCPRAVTINRLIINRLFDHNKN